MPMCLFMALAPTGTHNAANCYAAVAKSAFSLLCPASCLEPCTPAHPKFPVYLPPPVPHLTYTVRILQSIPCCATLFLTTIARPLSISYCAAPWRGCCHSYCSTTPSLLCIPPSCPLLLTHNISIITYYSMLGNPAFWNTHGSTIGAPPLFNGRARLVMFNSNLSVDGYIHQ